jgi:hypothetical protein
MFYQVKILDAAGNVKKVISSNSLSRDYWDRNDQSQDTRMTFDFEGLEDESISTHTVGAKVSSFKLDDSVD